MTDVRSLQILCKKTNCQELFMKCLEFAKEHGSLYYSENLPGKPHDFYNMYGDIF